MKNALDWASKPLVDGPAPVQGKPVALCGSGGGLGTERAQLALRQTAVFMQLNVMTLPETLVRRWGGDVFDAAGDLKDNEAGEKDARSWARCSPPSPRMLATSVYAKR